MIGATNCDSNVFERPDKFNVYRPDIDIKRHLVVLQDILLLNQVYIIVQEQHLQN